MQLIEPISEACGLYSLDSVKAEGIHTSTGTAARRSLPIASRHQITEVPLPLLWR